MQHPLLLLDDRRVLHCLLVGDPLSPVAEDGRAPRLGDAALHVDCRAQGALVVDDVPGW